MASKVDLISGWEGLWGPIKAALGSGLTTALSVIGVAILVSALVTYAWQRRKGGGRGFGMLTWPLVIGAVCAAPEVLMPIFLKLAQWVADATVFLAASFVK